MLSKAISWSLALALAFVGLALPSTAEAKSPVNLTAKAALSVPVGSQDFQMIVSPQGPTFIQWVVRPSDLANNGTWQIWKADFNSVLGTLSNHTKVRELAEGTSILAQPVATNFGGAPGVVYSVLRDTGSSIESWVEVVTFEEGGPGLSYDLTALPFYSLNKADSDYLNNCANSPLACGYTKVALGGHPDYQTTVAALERNGQNGPARIGITSNFNFQEEGWSDPHWIDTNASANFDAQDAFSYVSSGGAYFAYVTRGSERNAVAVKVTLSSNPVAQTVGSPIRLDVFGAVRGAKLTRLNNNLTIATFVTEDYGSLQIWRAELSTQFDNVGSQGVVYAKESKMSFDGSYSVQKISDHRLEILVSSRDKRRLDTWSIDSVTVAAYDYESVVKEIAKGSDWDTRMVIAGNSVSRNNAFALPMNLLKDGSRPASTRVYQSDYGLISTPVRTKAAQIVDSAVFADRYNNIVWNANNVLKGANQYLELTKVQVKVSPRNIMPSLTATSAIVGQDLSLYSFSWSSMTEVQATGYKWVRCTKRVTTSVSGIPKTCKVIANANLESYLVTSADRGKYLSAVIWAKNLYGTNTQTLVGSKRVQ